MKTIVPHLLIEEVQFTEARRAQRRLGLLGWISCVVNRSLRLDGLALRRTESGTPTISFPVRRDASGRQHHIVRPVDDHARREIERQIFACLRFGDS